MYANKYCECPLRAYLFSHRSVHLRCLATAAPAIGPALTNWQTPNTFSFLLLNNLIVDAGDLIVDRDFDSLHSKLEYCRDFLLSLFCLNDLSLC